MKALLILSISLLAFGCHATKEVAGAARKRSPFLGGRGGAGGSGQGDGNHGKAGETGKGGIHVVIRR